MIIAALVPAVLVLAWGLAGILTHDRARLGDGASIESYGFDLSTLLAPRSLIVPGTLARDMIPALNDPVMIRGSEVARINAEERGKYLVADDRVIGVAIEGEARCYPLRMLDVHEIINDSIAGIPIAVTYSPWCDSAATFDRRVEGETLEFGASGLLYNANLLMYDRRGDGALESLWSQLEARAIAGPAAEEEKKLARIPFALLRWEDWLALHPDTLVLQRNPVPSLRRRYERDTYGPYFSRRQLPEHMPVEPLPATGDDSHFVQIVGVHIADSIRVFSIPEIASRADEPGIWRTTIDGNHLSFRVFDDDPPAVLVTDSTGQPAAVAYAFWFGWYAAHPGAELE